MFRLKDKLKTWGDLWVVCVVKRKIFFPFDNVFCGIMRQLCHQAALCCGGVRWSTLWLARLNQTHFCRIDGLTAVGEFLAVTLSQCGCHCHTDNAWQRDSVTEEQLAAAVFTVRWPSFYIKMIRVEGCLVRPFSTDVPSCCGITTDKGCFVVCCLVISRQQ